MFHREMGILGHENPGLQGRPLAYAHLAGHDQGLSLLAAFGEAAVNE
jgi:hypothetical protein